MVAQFVKPFLGGKYPAHALSNSKLQHSCKFKTCKFRTCYANPESGLHGLDWDQMCFYVYLKWLIKEGARGQVKGFFKNEHTEAQITFLLSALIFATVLLMDNSYIGC